MFLNKLYTIIQRSEEPGQVVARIHIDASHEIYEGHFPENPVTPGVVQLEIIKEILASHLGLNLRMKTMRTCKFLQIINPLETPELDITIKFTQGETIEAIASASNADQQFLKVQLSYQII